MNLLEVEELMLLMVKNRALAVTIGDVSVSLHPTAFTPREVPDSEPAVPTDCRCGHRVAEHNDLGCIAQATPGVPPCGCDRPWGEDDSGMAAE